MTEDDIKLCNCAECGQELVGRSCLSWWMEQTAEYKKVHPMVAGRLKGRPYCRYCITPRKPKLYTGRVIAGDTNPSHDDAARNLEGR